MSGIKLRLGGYQPARSVHTRAMHVFADALGRYSLETIVPGEYPGRTRHIHVKLRPAGGRVLTTQLYFPDEPGNRSDGIYRRDLTMRVARDGARRSARFDFVIAG